MKLSELYSEYFANFVSGGNLVTQDKISLLGLKPLFDRFITHDWVTKVWMVKAFPVESNINFTDLIRTEMFALNPKVKTVINIVSEPVNVNVRSNMFMKQFEAVSQRYKDVENLFDSWEEAQRTVGVYDINKQSGRKMYITESDLKKLKDEYESYLYVYKQATEGHSFTNTFYFIQASAKNRNLLKKYAKDLAGLLASQDILFTELHGNISGYLENFCPASYPNSPNGFNSVLTTDVNLSGLMPYKTMGLVGGEGVLVGLDKLTSLPFLLDFFHSGTAQVCLIEGKTGCGKTSMAFALALGLVGLGLHFSATDIKGNEWVKIAKFVDCLIIGMDSAKSQFVNTLRIDDVEYEEYEDYLEAYKTAVRGTVHLFEIAVNLQPNEGNITDLEAILDRAVAKVFSKVGVKPENPSTYYKSANLKYADVIDVVSSLITSASFTEQQKHLCQLIITRTSEFFLPEGRYADSFSSELSLQDVLNTPGIIYEFNKNSDVMLSTLDTMRVFMVQFLDGKKQSYRKQRKLHTAAFYEELQRCSSFGLLVDEISHKVTGSRSNNVIIFLLLNSITTLNSEEFAAIKSNITTKIIGKVNSADVKKMVDDFDCAPIEEFMTQICEDQTNTFSHCFAIQYDTGIDTNKVMCQTVMPPEMQEHFSTRDHLAS